MKKGLLLAWLPLLAVMSCSGTKAETNYIGIVSAMDNEISLLLKVAKISETKTVGEVTFHIGTLQNKPVVISRAGIGKVRASSGMASMLNCFNISSVIFTGVAGGTREEEQVLDQIIGTSLIEHDYGTQTNDGFVWGGGDPGKEEKGDVFYCDEKLVNLAYETSVASMGSEGVYKGLIATGDQFIASADYVTWLREKFDAYACEMEGAAIARVCTTFQKPFVVLRTLSDMADGSAHESYQNFADLAADQSSAIVIQMVESM